MVCNKIKFPNTRVKTKTQWSRTELDNEQIKKVCNWNQGGKITKIKYVSIYYIS